jgi:hypothetical protein
MEAGAIHFRRADCACGFDGHEVLRLKAGLRPPCAQIDQVHRLPSQHRQR